MSANRQSVVPIEAQLIYQLFRHHCRGTCFTSNGKWESTSVELWIEMNSSRLMIFITQGLLLVKLRFYQPESCVYSPYGLDQNGGCFNREVLAKGKERHYIYSSWMCFSL